MRGPDHQVATEIVPEGTAPPEGIPGDAFEAALATYLDMRRLDMRALAAQLGISRATLYRRVGSRDHLLGQVLWYLTRIAITGALEAARGLSGAPRVVAVVANFMRFVDGQAAFHRLLDAEPEAALRLLTSPQGPVQPALAEALERLLAEEERESDLRLVVDRRTLAYVIVRIGEGFLYADVIADNEPDLEKAIEVIGKLL